jgi:hypothetical protein
MATTVEKLDGLKAVAPDGRVGQYWTRNGTAEADAFQRFRAGPAQLSRSPTRV